MSAVYFIRVGDYFKIGASDYPAGRFERLHMGSTRYTFPPGLSLAVADRELYRTVEGWKTEERQIHLALDDFAVGLEWFLDEPPVREFIDSLPDCIQGKHRPLVFPKVERVGGWCEAEYRAVQEGRGLREVARHQTARSAAKRRSA